MMKLSTDFYSGSDYDSISNCRNTRLYLDEFIGTTCYHFVYFYREQASFLLRLSPFLFLFSFINFFGVLGSRTKLIEDDIYGMGAVRSSTTITGPIQNVDDAPKGWNSKKNLESKSSKNLKKQKFKKNVHDIDGFDFENDNHGEIGQEIDADSKESFLFKDVKKPSDPTLSNSFKKENLRN